MAYWEQRYSANQEVEVLRRDAWRAGRVDSDWVPRPGFGVKGRLHSEQLGRARGAPFRIGTAAEIRPA